MSQNGIEVRDLRPGGWFRLDNAVIDDHGAELGAYGIAVYCVLCRFADNETQETYPSLATIAGLIGCSRRTVIRIIPKLEELGLICVEKVRSEHGDYDHNRYWLLAVGGSDSQSPPTEGVVTHSHQGSDSQSHDQDPCIKTDGLWSQVLIELQATLTQGTFDRWLRGSRLVSMDNGHAVVSVGDEYARDWLSHRLRPTVERSLSAIAGGELHIEFKTG